MNELELVLDFGGQYKELIARTVRRLPVYSEIMPGYLTSDGINGLNTIGIILTGGFVSAHSPDSPKEPSNNKLPGLRGIFVVTRGNKNRAYPKVRTGLSRNRAATKSCQSNLRQIKI